MLRKRHSFRWFNHTRSMATSVTSIVGKNGVTLATHLTLRSVDSAESLQKRVIADMKKYPDCHFTIMTPTMLIDHHANDSLTKGVIEPGHIHATCTDENGNIVPEGDASFTSSGMTVMDMLTPAYDSRLIGYQPRDMAIYKSKFTSSTYEISKWAFLARNYRHYPLHLLAIPFKSGERARYLAVVDQLKKEYVNIDYVLMRYYQPGENTVVKESNCITFNAATNALFYNARLLLGDNATTQAAFYELINHVFSHCHDFSAMTQPREHLSEVHFESGHRHHYSLVI